jgi:SPFH domain / Band 7 family
MSHDPTKGPPISGPGEPQPGSLEAKPPAILENIAWFLAHWRENKLAIVIAILIVGLPSAFGLRNWWSKDPDRTAPAQQNEIKKPAKNTSPALKVRFGDGTIAFVEFSFSFALDPAAAPRVFQTYGNEERAVNDLKEAVEGAAYKSMTKLTFNEANTNRDKIEAAIIEMTKSAQERTGHKIYQVNIKQIERAQ